MRLHQDEFWGWAFGSPSAPWAHYFEWRTWASHLLLLHALHQDWINRIDPPMWSVGVEWLNYFLMPLLFLPVWRRLGGVLLVVFATVFAFVPYVITIAIHDAPAFSHPARFVHDFVHVGEHPEWRSFHFMQPWFIALFAIGMAGAALQFPRHAPRRVRWVEEAFLNVAVHPVGLAVLALGIYVCRHQRVPLDFFVGAATISLILHCTRGTLLGRAARWVLESRISIFLGAISYSLYLFHGPLLVLLHRGLEPSNLAAGTRLVAFTGAGVPVVLLAGWVGYRVFERPFFGAGEMSEGAQAA